MTWRPPRPPQQPASKGDDYRPSLEEVLTHYGVHDHRRMVPCPLHEDKTPSCSINYQRGLFNCHSCGEAGDAYNLIMLKEGVDFVGARAFAASHHFGAESSGGNGQQVPGSRFTRRPGGAVPARPRTGSGNGDWVPSWRRR